MEQRRRDNRHAGQLIGSEFAVKAAPDELKDERKTGGGENNKQRDIADWRGDVEEKAQGEVRSDTGQRQYRCDCVSARRRYAAPFLSAGFSVRSTSTVHS